MFYGPWLFSHQVPEAHPWHVVVPSPTPFVSLSGFWSRDWHRERSLLSPRPLPRDTEVLGGTWCCLSTGCKTSSPVRDTRGGAKARQGSARCSCVFVCAGTCTPSPAAMPGIRSRPGQAPGRGSCLSPAPPALCQDPPARKQSRRGPGATAGRESGAGGSPGDPRAREPGAEHGQRGQRPGFAAGRWLHLQDTDQAGSPGAGDPRRSACGAQRWGTGDKDIGSSGSPAPLPGCGHGEVMPPPAPLHPQRLPRSVVPPKPLHSPSTPHAPLKCSHQVPPVPGHPPLPKVTLTLLRTPAASAATRTPGHPRPKIPGILHRRRDSGSDPGGGGRRRRGRDGLHPGPRPT